MPVTSTWQIPFPNNTDNWCDGDEYTTNIADRLDDIMAQFDIDLARISVPEYANVSSRVNTSYSVNPLALPVVTNLPAIYTDVDADTGAFVSMTSDPTSIVLPTPAFNKNYIMMMHAEMNVPAAASGFGIGEWIPSINGSGSVSGGSEVDRMLFAGGTFCQSTAAYAFNHLTTDPAFTLQGYYTEPSYAQPWILSSATMAFFWIGDA